MPEKEEEAEESRGPKVVDKRISSGGHTPSRPSAPAPAKSASTPPEPSEQAPGKPGEQVWTPEQEEQAKRIVEEIVKTPSLDWVLQSAVNLANVAGTKLEMGAAEDARLAIDALAAMVNSLGDRLQDAQAPLKQTLAQLQLAFASRAAPGEEASPEAPGE